MASLAPVKSKLDAFYLPAAGGQRFCLFHAPAEDHQVRGGIVFVQPFAEEMNRSRRMVALQARAFAESGFAVLAMDLYGCGDSSGDLATASWSAWLEDVAMASQWMQARVEGSLWLWGLRAGCLLAAQASPAVRAPFPNLLLWQPVLSGRQHLQQFLRLRFAADLVRSERGETVDVLKQRLSSGQTLEVAGYSLPPQLAQGLEQADLQSCKPPAGVDCFEVLPSAGMDLSPGVNGLMRQWQAGSAVVNAQAVVGPSFWQSAETEVCPSLVEHSLSAVSRLLR